jgi:hypothetical protein
MREMSNAPKLSSTSVAALIFFRSRLLPTETRQWVLLRHVRTPVLLVAELLSFADTVAKTNMSIHQIAELKLVRDV